MKQNKIIEFFETILGAIRIIIEHQNRLHQSASSWSITANLVKIRLKISVQHLSSIHEMAVHLQVVFEVEAPHPTANGKVPSL